MQNSLDFLNELTICYLIILRWDQLWFHTKWFLTKITPLGEVERLLVSWYPIEWKSWGNQSKLRKWPWRVLAFRCTFIEDSKLSVYVRPKLAIRKYNQVGELISEETVTDADDIFFLEITLHWSTINIEKVKISELFQGILIMTL